MNDELAEIAGKYEELVGKLQEKYGIASDKSEHQRDDFKKIFEDLKKSNARLVRLQRHHETGKLRVPTKSRGKPARRKAVPPPASRKKSGRTTRA
jgi:DNA-binding protein H-NS